MNAEATDEYGTAIQIAAKYGHETVVQLLESGADVNAPPGPEGTALEAARSGSHTKVVELLLKNGASE